MEQCDESMNFPLCTALLLKVSQKCIRLEIFLQKTFHFVSSPYSISVNVNLVLVVLGFLAYTTGLAPPHFFGIKPPSPAIVSTT